MSVCMQVYRVCKSKQRFIDQAALPIPTYNIKIFRVPQSTPGVNLTSTACCAPPASSLHTKLQATSPSSSSADKKCFREPWPKRSH